MFFSSSQPRKRPSTQFKKYDSLHRVFQRRFVLLLTSASLFSTLLFSFFAFYFTYENMNLFISLSFDSHPQFVRHLERESHWIMMALAISFVATGFSIYKISMRMTSHLINPLVEMEKHMKEVTLGRWQSSPFRLSDSHDFRNLTLTYDYLLSTLRSTTENEIQLLSRLRLDHKDRESIHIWGELLNEKRRRLGLEEISVTSLVTDVTPNQRRVS